MNRRSFLTKTLAATAAASAAPVALGAASSGSEGPSNGAPFRMKFGPHIGQLKHHAGDNILDQMQFAYDVGFRAWEDNGLKKRDTGTQNAMAKFFEKTGMTMGVFVAFADFKNPVFSGNRLDIGDRHRDPKAVREMLKKEMEASVELAKRTGVKWATVVPGAIDPSVLPEYQTANAVENLKFCAEICEKSGLVLVLEPLNYMNHPGCLLQRASHANQICRMVGSPSVKILFDIYHQQITEGNLINNMNDAWDEIAYIQIGDVPGRKEPTTGEINYKNVFQWIHDKGYRGVAGMEHGVSGEGVEGERAMIEAYRSVDVR